MMFGRYPIHETPAPVRRQPRTRAVADLDADLDAALAALAQEFGIEPDAPSADDLDSFLRAIGE